MGYPRYQMFAAMAGAVPVEASAVPVEAG